MRLAGITLDCADPHELAAFWSRLLGAPIAYESDAYAGLRVGGQLIGALRIDDYVRPSWPEFTAGRLHFELAVTDLDASESEVLAAGAVKASHQPGGDVWRVYLDPAGHPFCLTTAIPS